MIHLSSYHSNGLPTVVWSNKVNLIGEKVYKPKIHFCEHCNKPILIYGRLIPCKHVFCFTCATLCLTQQPHQQSNKSNSATSPSPIIPGPSEPPLTTNHLLNQSSPMQNYSPHNNNNLSGSSLRNNSDNNYTNHLNDKQHLHRQAKSGNHTNNNTSTNSNNTNCNYKNFDYHKGDSNQSTSIRDLNNTSSINIDESTSNTTPTTIHQDNINSPTINGTNNSLQGQLTTGKGCHRCGGRALRVERNSLNSIFVCQIETCRRTYLSARDLQAHVTHRHSKGKSNQNAGTSGSLAAISSSPYISSSTLMHLNNQSGNSRSISNSSTHANHNNTHDSFNHQHRHRHGERDSMNHRHHRDRERDRHRDRDTFQRERERERDSKEYHRQSLQRAAQWAEASAQMLEKGITR